MNRIHRSIWNQQTATFVAVAENTSSAGKKISSVTASLSSPTSGLFGLKVLAVSVMMACAATAFAQPVGGVVSAGSATIGGTPGAMVITQTTANVAINWQSFSILAGESVQFVQPSTSSVALNRVVGPNPSSIFGNLSANGKVFLVNPNGILFGTDASVNVGGLVASTRGISDTDFMANNYRFSGAGTATVVNDGEITAADGGYVALLGANVSNQGSIVAQLGTVALAAGNAMTLDMAGDQLLSVTIDEGVVNALVANGGLIQADGGRVVMTTQAAGSLLANTVNNTGVIQAQTILNEEGSIRLLGGMETGTVNVASTSVLDASAPTGDGGFIETSAARVEVDNAAVITTMASLGQETGEWLIGSQDFSIGGSSSDNIAGATLGALLVNNSVTISTAVDADGEVVRSLPVNNLFAPAAGSGNIEVNEVVSWTASASPTTLTLLAGGDTNINDAITANTGNLVVCCGRDVNVNAAITTTNGSVMLGAGRDVNVVRNITAPLTRITTTDGNIQICAARDVTLNNAHDGAALITLTSGSTTAGEDLANLGVSRGLTLSAGTGGTGPGPDGGTVRFVNGGLAGTYITTTGPDPVTPTNIYYNPTSYETPTDFSLFFTGTGSPLNQYMLVFPDGGDKNFDGTTSATLSGLKGAPTGVSLQAGPGSSASFDSATAGTDKTISFTGYTLTGANAGDYAFAVPCCGAIAAMTTANITAASGPGGTPPAPPPAARPPASAPQPSAPPPPMTAAPVASPAMDDTPLPTVQTPYTSPAFASQGFVFTVSPPTPLPSSTLVVQAPAALEELPAAATPLAVPIATPPAPYQPPVRRPKPERN